MLISVDVIRVAFFTNLGMVGVGGGRGGGGGGPKANLEGQGGLQSWEQQKQGPRNWRGTWAQWRRSSCCCLGPARP